MDLILIVLIVVLIFGGGFGYSRWGYGGGIGIGSILLILLIAYLGLDAVGCDSLMARLGCGRPAAQPLNGGTQATLSCPNSRQRQNHCQARFRNLAFLTHVAEVIRNV